MYFFIYLFGDIHIYVKNCWYHLVVLCYSKWQQSMYIAVNQKLQYNTVLLLGIVLDRIVFTVLLYLFFFFMYFIQNVSIG